jgi:hypothetical protein
LYCVSDNLSGAGISGFVFRLTDSEAAPLAVGLSALRRRQRRR